MGKFIASRGFIVYVSVNMLVCTVVFLPWALPRETVSGLLGRWMVGENVWQRRVAAPLSWLVDRLYFWEPDHCAEVARMEADARRALYP